MKDSNITILQKTPFSVKKKAPAGRCTHGQRIFIYFSFLLEHNGVLLEHNPVLLEHNGVFPEHNGVLLEHNGVLLEHIGVLLERNGVFPEQNEVLLEHNRVLLEQNAGWDKQKYEENCRIFHNLASV